MGKLRRRNWGRGEVRRQPEGKIRQSQVVTTFGPGAMVDLVDHAVLVGGLNFWKYATHKTGKGIRVIHEPRLRDALAERLRPRGIELHFENAFREPPAGDDDDPSDGCGVQALEFPQWFVCQNPSCRALSRNDGLEKKDGKYHHDCARKKRTECVPVRFVLACRLGHVDEFPWIWFAHRNQAGRCPAPLLRLLEGSTGDFSEIRVACVCGARASLASALVPESRPECRGTRPWLGREGREECEEKARLLVRTASNSYFAQVVSALSIPDPARELEDAIRGVWKAVKKASSRTLPVIRETNEEVEGALRRFSDADVLAAIESINAGAGAPREAIRTAEFRQLVGSPTEQLGDLPQQDEVFFARTVPVPAPAPPQIDKLVLAHKLREVRVQIGFTRIEATTADLQGEYDVGVESAALGLATDWLPASEVRGEGVLLSFSEKAIRAWEALPAVKKRERQLEDGYEAWMESAENAPPFPGARFYMLHSLAHLLITAISLECGYSASSIRERIYCAGADEPLPMAAILLSTGTSGQEGTLGGLVEQGRRIGDHLRRAWDLGVLCSNDPVCANHSPSRDPSERHLEGAACHGCLFIAECSCERFNRYLDRALVVPSIGHPAELAFFPARP